MTTRDVKATAWGKGHRSVTVLLAGAADAALIGFCERLSKAGVAVRIVSDQPQELPSGAGDLFLANSGEQLWEVIPPSSLVVTTDPIHEAEVLSNTGFPCLRVSVMDDTTAGRVLNLLQTLDSKGPAFRGPMLSVCMIVKNEEKNIEQALRSLCGVAGEIVVVDTGSTDETVAIARRYGARVYFYQWTDDFAAARNESLAHAAGDWVLVLDADERLSPEFRKNVRSLLQSVRDEEAFITPIVSAAYGRETLRVSVVRLFRNRPGYRYEGRVHEQVYHSIIRAGGKIVEAPHLYTIIHFGYTASENARKGRRTRNRQLLIAAQREDPTRIDYWYHLGEEAFLVKDLQTAAFWLGKVVEEGSKSLFSHLALPLFASTLMGLGQNAKAWHVAHMGISTVRAQSQSLAALAEIAFDEGDFATLDWCADRLRCLPPGSEGIVQTETLAEQCSAQSLLLQDRLSEVLAAVDRLLQADPGNWPLAFWGVTLLEKAAGVRSATVEAIQRYGTTAVKAAAIRPLVHAGEWALAGQLAEVTGKIVQSPYHVVAYLHAGRSEVAVETADKLGVDGAMPLILWGLERNEPEILDAGMTDDIAPCHRTVVQHIQQGKKVPDSLEWVPRLWMKLASQLRMDRIFERLTGILPGEHSSQIAKAALVLYEDGRKQEGLRLALEAPYEAEALQVLGLAAYANQDWEAAATFLTTRVSLGHAPVQVYWRGAQAWKQLGRPKEVHALLEEGRKARPLSKLLAADDILKLLGADGTKGRPSR